MTRKTALFTLLSTTSFAWICVVGVVGGVVGVVGADESAASEPALVATRLLTASRYEVELSDRVGALSAGKQQTLAFEIPGRLDTLTAEGQRVALDKQLGRLDDSLELLRLRRAEILLTQARTELKRFSQLARLRVSSPSELENAESTVDLGHCLPRGGQRAVPPSEQERRAGPAGRRINFRLQAR